MPLCKSSDSPPVFSEANAPCPLSSHLPRVVSTRGREAAQLPGSCNLQVCSFLILTSAPPIRSTRDVRKSALCLSGFPLGRKTGPKRQADSLKSNMTRSTLGPEMAAENVGTLDFSEQEQGIRHQHGGRQGSRRSNTGALPPKTPQCPQPGAL